VTAIRDLGGGLEVVAGDTAYSCDRVVVCADAWTGRLLEPLGVRLPLTVTLEQVTYFAPPDPTAYRPGRLPLWIWMDEPSFYGFPCYGEDTVKAAQDCGGPAVDPDDRTSDVDATMERRLADFMQRLLPGSGPPVRSLRCQYTLTPDRDFLLDAVPEHPGVVAGLGAAHGFKFAPTLGRLLADLAVDGACATDVSAFRFDRPGLTDPEFEASWMV
jgi:sarcosine oxidase